MTIDQANTDQLASQAQVDRWPHLNTSNCSSTILWHTSRMPEHRDLTLIDPDNKLGRDVAIMRAEIEEVHTKLAALPAVIARAALGIIFSTAVVTTFVN